LVDDNVDADALAAQINQYSKTTSNNDDIKFGKASVPSFSMGLSIGLVAVGLVVGVGALAYAFRVKTRRTSTGQPRDEELPV
jgi:hypothetical protein